MANEIKWSAKQVSTVAAGVFDVVVPFTFDGAFTPELEARVRTAYSTMAKKGGKLCPFYEGMHVELVGISATGEGSGTFTARQMHD